MKIVEPKYEILTDISEGGIKELQQIERVARVCYKSEDKITPDGESAKKLVGFLVKQGHEAMLEHERYITALDELGFEMFRTKAGVNICHTTSTGSFMINLNGEDFVDMLVSYAETFDPNTYVSLKVKSHSSTQDISAVLKNAQEIQILLLRLAIKLVKIRKEVE